MNLTDSIHNPFFGTETERLGGPGSGGAREGAGRPRSAQELAKEYGGKKFSSIAAVKAARSAYFAKLGLDEKVALAAEDEHSGYGTDRNFWNSPEGNAATEFSRAYLEAKYGSELTLWHGSATDPHGAEGEDRSFTFSKSAANRIIDEKLDGNGELFQMKIPTNQVLNSEPFIGLTNTTAKGENEREVLVRIGGGPTADDLADYTPEPHEVAYKSTTKDVANYDKRVNEYQKKMGFGYRDKNGNWVEPKKK